MGTKKYHNPYHPLQEVGELLLDQVIPENDQNTSLTNQKTSGNELERTKLADVLWLSEASEKLFR